MQLNIEFIQFNNFVMSVLTLLRSPYSQAVLLGNDITNVYYPKNCPVTVAEKKVDFKAREAPEVVDEALITKAQRTLIKLCPKDYHPEQFLKLAESLTFLTSLGRDEVSLRVSDIKDKEAKVVFGINVDLKFVDIVTKGDSVYMNEKVINILYNKRTGVAIKTEITGNRYVNYYVFEPATGDLLFSRHSKIHVGENFVKEFDTHNTFYGAGRVALRTEFISTRKEMKYIVVNRHVDDSTFVPKLNKDVKPVVFYKTPMPIPKKVTSFKKETSTKKAASKEAPKKETSTKKAASKEAPKKETSTKKSSTKKESPGAPRKAPKATNPECDLASIITIQDSTTKALNWADYEDEQ